MGKSLAITVGINQYEFLQPLNYAMQDAQRMQQFLETQAGFEKTFFFSDDSLPIRGKSTRPTRANLRRILLELSEKPATSTLDSFWFFFSGHGIRHRGQDFLVPSDGNIKDEETLVSLNFVTECLSRIGANNVVLIIDACRNNGIRSGKGIGEQTALEASKFGIISFLSCSPDEYSYEIDQLQQGAFTHALLDGLGTPGQCATVRKLEEYVAKRVPELVKQYKKGRQHPYITVEPASKSSMVLIPKYASEENITKLKADAIEAERFHNFQLAKQLWNQVILLSPNSSDGLAAIKRIEEQEEIALASKQWTTLKIPIPKSNKYRNFILLSSALGLTSFMGIKLWGNTIFPPPPATEITSSPTPTSPPTPSPVVIKLECGDTPDPLPDFNNQKQKIETNVGLVYGLDTNGTGKGTIVYTENTDDNPKKGEIYTGGFVKYKYEGCGTLRANQDGPIKYYITKFINNNAQEGVWMISYKDGTYYYGNVKKTIRQGLGILIGNGKKECGMWENDYIKNQMSCNEFLIHNKDGSVIN